MARTCRNLIFPERFVNRISGGEMGERPPKENIYIDSINLVNES